MYLETKRKMNLNPKNMRLDNLEVKNKVDQGNSRITLKKKKNTEFKSKLSNMFTLIFLMQTIHTNDNF